MDADRLYLQLEEAYRQHLQQLYVIALAITGCPAQAEDAVQEAFARVASRNPQIVGNMLAYLVTSVRNAAFDLQRKAAPRHPADLVSYLDPQAADPAAALQQSELQQQLLRHLSTLEAQDREILAMRLHADLTFQQIADALGEPLQTVASRYRRALGKLRQQLDSYAASPSSENSHAG